jgi:hypothetical protein
MKQISCNDVDGHRWTWFIMFVDYLTLQRLRHLLFLQLLLPLLQTPAPLRSLLPDSFDLFWQCKLIQSGTKISIIQVIQA